MVTYPCFKRTFQTSQELKVIEKWIDEENVFSTYSGIFFSFKNKEIMKTWCNLSDSQRHNSWKIVIKEGKGWGQGKLEFSGF